MTESKRYTICKNRRAPFNYLIEETIEAGIVELGLRVRSQMGVLPFVHEVRAQLARVCDDEKTCECECAEAARLWTEMGAPGHIERMARDLAELKPEL